MLSNLYHHVLRVILYLEHLSIQQESAVSTRNQGVPKITFTPSFFLIWPSVEQTRDHIDFMLHFLHQSVALLTKQCSDTLFLSQTQKLSSK